MDENKLQTPFCWQSSWQKIKLCNKLDGLYFLKIDNLDLKKLEWEFNQNFNFCIRQLFKFNLNYSLFIIFPIKPVLSVNTKSKLCHENNDEIYFIICVTGRDQGSITFACSFPYSQSKRGSIRIKKAILDKSLLSHVLYSEISWKVDENKKSASGCGIITKLIFVT